MSSLQRYKKSGGFIQLLSLIETFGPAKKEKFLEMIEGESAPWAAALRDKMITLDRVFSWPDQVVVEIFKALPIKSQSYALEGLTPEQKPKILQFYSTSDLRRVSDVLTENQPKPEEIQSSLFKVVESARKMIQDRELLPEKFDAGLTISEDFESKLQVQYGGVAAKFGGSKGAPDTMKVVSAPTGPAVPSPGLISAPPDATVPAEVYQLQRTLAAVLRENKTLKDEVRTLQIRLDNIKKMAA